jgi:hypothetical protein
MPIYTFEDWIYYDYHPKLFLRATAPF